MSEYSFKWFHPEMIDPIEVSIAFEGQWFYDSVANREYERVEPYIEAVYVGNTDIMPLMRLQDLIDIMKAYEQSKKEANYE